MQQESVKINKSLTYGKVDSSTNHVSTVLVGRSPRYGRSSDSASKQHNRFVTPQNIDDLILKLNQMESGQAIVATPRLQAPREGNSGESLNKHHQLQTNGIPTSTQYSTDYSSTNNRIMFTDHFMQQSRLNNTEVISKTEETSEGSMGINWKQQPSTKPKRCARLAPIDHSKLAGTTPSASIVHPFRSSYPSVETHPLSVLDLLRKTSGPLKIEATPIKSITTNQIHKKPLQHEHQQPTLTIKSNHTSCRPKVRPLLPQQQHAPPITTTSSSTSGVDEVDPIVSDTDEDNNEDDDSLWYTATGGEDEVMSDINDDDVTGSILTNTSGIGMEDSESDYMPWGVEEVDVEDEPSSEMISGCGPLGDIHHTLDVPMIPSRVLSVGEMRGLCQATPPLTPSLFPGRSPTIHFPLANERYDRLSPNERSLLKWKMSSITPNVVKRVISRVGFKATNGTRWIGYWGKHMKSEAFREIAQDQKVNHFPGSFNLGRKDRLWRNLFKMQAQYGRKEFDFIPETYVLPNDLRHFKRVWDSSVHKTTNKWIIKPPASARGIGIKVVNKWSQIPKKRPVIVQRYISNPFLINGSKFDLRVYVYVSSFDPLIIYIYRDGLVRFATVKYSKSLKKLSNRYMHLTNYSVNKQSSQFVANSDETQCYGHKWGLLALWGYFSDQLAIDPAPVWDRIKDVVIKTIISCEGTISSLVKANVRHRSCVHELFGFDIMLDKTLKPWLLEVNVSPSLHSNSSLDVNIKEVMIRDVFNMSRFKLPSHHSESHIPMKRLQPEDKAKIDLSTVLDQLTEDDCNVLMDLEDEFSRRGSFLRVFPNTEGADYSQYGKYFHIQRYYNILVHYWVSKHSKYPSEGISQLRKYIKHK